MGEGGDTTDLIPSEPPLNAGQRTEECMKGSFKENLWQGLLSGSSNGLSGSLVTLVTLISHRSQVQPKTVALNLWNMLAWVPTREMKRYFVEI